MIVNIDPSQEIFAIDILRALKSSLKHRRKMFCDPTTIWKLGSYFWQSNYNWVVDRRNMSVQNLLRSQLHSEEEFTDQRFSHFKQCIAVNFKSLKKKICPKL